MPPDHARRLPTESILTILPHRYPFVLVDTVWDWDGLEGLGKKNVSMGEPCFQGHFPNHPIFPGVLQLEGLAQCGAVLAIAKLVRAGEVRAGAVPEVLFLGIDNCRFKQVVVPGDSLMFQIRITKLATKLVKFNAVATVEGAVTCEADMMAMLRFPEEIV